MMRTKQVLITSPPYTLKILKNFPLRNLEKTFVIADFERLLNIRHVNKILRSMSTNEFFDNIISVVLKKNGQYEVIDGQHRITALGLLRDDFYVTKYDLVLMIFQEKASRKIYRQINLGKPLKLQDHLRALDNNKNSFFEKLRPHFVHYNDGKLPKFETILNALVYAKNGSPRAVQPLLLDRMFRNITENDLKIIQIFSKELKKIEPFIPKQRQKLYMSSVYRNMFRVGYENNFDKTQWENFITICKTDKISEKLQYIRTMSAVKELYSHMITNIGKKAGVQLQKVERTGGEAKNILNSPSKLAI